MINERKVLIVKMLEKAERLPISARFGIVVPGFLRASVSLW
jgi:hypothetical protein